MPAPSLDELRALARRAAQLAGGEALAAAAWERDLHARPGRAHLEERLVVEVTCRRDDRAATVRTTAVDEDGLARAARGAAALAATAGAPACGPLGTPSAGRAHDGWDPAVLTLDPAHVAAALSEPAGAATKDERPPGGRATDAGERPRAGRATDAGERPRAGRATDAGERPRAGRATDAGERPRAGRATDAGERPRAGRATDAGERRRVGGAAPGERLEWWAGAARTAIASSAGAEVAEQRSAAVVEARAWGAGRSARAVRAAVSPAALDAGATAEEAREWLGAGAAPAAPPGEHAVVLGPLAVAAVLDRLRHALGPAGRLATHRGQRVVAPAINLSDSPRFPGTLPRSYDAAGTPRAPVPLIQDGVAHGSVSPASGHAADPTGRGAAPEHLVLVGGGASDLEELLAPLERGLLVWDLDGADRASGLFLVEDGRRGPPLRDALVRLDPLALLAATQALTAQQWLVPSGARSARALGATLAPALRASGGLTVSASGLSGRPA